MLIKTKITASVNFLPVLYKTNLMTCF